MHFRFSSPHLWGWIPRMGWHMTVLLMHGSLFKPLTDTFCGSGNVTLCFTSSFNMCTGPQESAAGQWDFHEFIAKEARRAAGINPTSLCYYLISRNVKSISRSPQARWCFAALVTSEYTAIESRNLDWRGFGLNRWKQPQNKIRLGYERVPWEVNDFEVIQLINSRAGSNPGLSDPDPVC